MAESVRLLASLAVDGRALRSEHAVLLQAEPPAEDWLIALLGVANGDLERLPGRHLVCITDSQGRCLHGAVEVAVGQAHSYVRLQGAGPLLQSAGARTTAISAFLRSPYAGCVASEWRRGSAKHPFPSA